MLSISGGYKNYPNGAVSNQLTDVEMRGESVGDDIESVEVSQRACIPQSKKSLYKPTYHINAFEYPYSFY